MKPATADGASKAGRMNLFEIERAALRDLVHLVESRAAASAAARDAHKAATAGAERELTRARRQIASGRERDLAAVTTAYEEAQRKITEQYKAETEAAETEYADTKRTVSEECDATEKQAKLTLQDAKWTADSLYEAAEKRATDDREAARRSAAKTADRLGELWTEAEAPLARANLFRADVEVPAGRADGGVIVDPGRTIDEELDNAEHFLADLRDSRLLRLATVVGLLIFVVPFAILGSLLFFVMQDKVTGLLLGAGVALALATVTWLLVRRYAFNQAVGRAAAFGTAVGRVTEARAVLLKRADAEYARRMAEAAGDRDRAKAHADAAFRPVMETTSARRKTELGDATEKYGRAKERLRNWRAEAADAAEEHYARETQACTERYDRALAAAEETHKQITREANEALAEAERIIATEWVEGQDRVGRAINKLRANGLEHFPDWTSPFWYNPPAAIKVPAGVRFGDFDVDLEKLPGGLPPFEDEGDVPTLPIRMKVPAFLPFPDRCSLLMKARDQGRARGVAAIQAIMLRLLTAVPPGKLRFTIIDPVGLGENFAAFMHLADYDEQLVGARIWTEPRDIEKRLADITAHMETVIQKYLRNQYRTIEEYNAQAGEVAEPFRVLIVANFPVNFSLDAARRLVSIVNSGPSCGVYTLITYDPKAPLPQGFNLADLEQGSINLQWKEGAFIWKDGDFAKFPLELETPPELSETTRLVRLVGERSKNANRVEVPFEYVAPRPLEVWTGDSRGGLSVAIGRAGATKRQMFAVGKGTAQHALVAGKTGSGKSTLLHALITNLAMNYSPDEVELYLIDFKKGVEFKPYAQYRLPHAKAVAIESEREFGLSVLQRLDTILKERGDLFREAGVNSLAEYREYLDRQSGAKSEAKITEDADTRIVGAPSKYPSCPRILLIVDEFQEFFVEDDRVSQECALLLDRLVRQGRAFGLHVLLGSQTLGGAFSLARSTIDQMAIRIALQCSDADAQLILSKENNAARLLSRPGEAIYNDQNGLVEGNDLFQVVWLDDDKKDKMLAELRSRADTMGRAAATPLVFEGNVPAIIDRSGPLNRLLDADTYPATVRVPSAWLGDAVAIKDPTAAVFRQSGGQNLLIVGQQDEAALATVTSAIVSLALQYKPDGLKMFVLDGTPDDDPNAGYLARVAAVLPHPVRMIDRTDLGPAFEAVSKEVTARQKNETPDRSPVFVFVHGAQRFRDLRKEDDFGFGRRGAERTVPPAEHLATILKDGPTVNVFVVLWADTPTNLGRVVDRAGMREFAMRVLFQMGVNDSSTLIDSPAAARLGRNRALFATEENAMPEKFRPYGLPSDAWLARVRERLTTRT
ncbi:MAG TPA: FtsK/SpoIIIE domain-containing protein [Gemmataceae bacterium]|jgi:S-DNA-T family DNA segregation ATPase FtsK/SpoIIIE|nr:FtsK/SpoIIIE domain-containing protein [Gemmataceae bacterium]